MIEMTPPQKKVEKIRKQLIEAADVLENIALKSPQYDAKSKKYVITQLKQLSSILYGLVVGV